MSEENTRRRDNQQGFVDGFKTCLETIIDMKNEGKSYRNIFRKCFQDLNRHSQVLEKEDWGA